MINLKDEILGLAQTFMQRKDSFVNAVTGMGTYRDKSTQTQVIAGPLLQPADCEVLYREDIPAKIVNKIVDEGMREGFDLVSGDDTDKGLEQAFFDRRQELLLDQKEAEAWRQGRLTGWGALYVLVDDGLPPEEPLDITKAQHILGVQVWERLDVLRIASWYNDPLNPRHNKPEVYEIRPRVLNVGSQSVDATTSRLIHESRLVVFEGPYTPRQTRLENMGFAMSVLQRPNQEILNFGSSWGAVNNLLADANQAVYKMKGLQNAVSAGSSNAVITRLGLIDNARSFMRAIVIDADSESFERHATSLVGYSDVLSTQMARVAAAADMPVTVLFGISPAGLNATGESDRGIWEDTIKGQQKDAYKPALELTSRIILRELGVSEDVPYKIQFRPLRQMTQKETAEIRKLVADTDSVYITAGVYVAEECAINRFSPSGFSMETTLDLGLRAQVLEIDQTTSNPTLAPTAEVSPALVLTPTAQAAIVRVNEARAQLGLPAFTPGEGGNLSITEFLSKNATLVAAASNAEAGDAQNKAPEIV